MDRGPVGVGLQTVGFILWEDMAGLKQGVTGSDLYFEKIPLCGKEAWKEQEWKQGCLLEMVVVQPRDSGEEKWMDLGYIWW